MSTHYFGPTQRSPGWVACNPPHRVSSSSRWSNVDCRLCLSKLIGLRLVTRGADRYPSDVIALAETGVMVRRVRPGTGPAGRTALLTYEELDARWAVA